LEITPNSPPVNATKIADSFDEDDFNFDSLIELYGKLSKIPRVTRGLISIIAEKGAFKRYNHDCEEYGILPKALQNFLRLTDQEMDSELQILRDANLIYIGEDDIDEKRFYYITLAWYTLNGLITACEEKNIPIKKLFSTMDFTILDE
jgi:hypothetical protein